MQESTPRYNIYAVIHKALRAMMADALIQAGRTDWQDAADRGETLATIRGLLDFCASHLEHENDFVHAAMEARQPGSSADGQADHRVHVNVIRDLCDQAAAVEALQGADAVRVGEALYRSLAVFVGENYEHMHFEETHNNQVLWSRYQDHEIMVIEHAIRASLPPQENAVVMRWMLPNVSAQERALILSDMREQAPPEVFQGAMGLLRVHLSASDWQKAEAAVQSAGPSPLAAAA